MTLAGGLLMLGALFVQGEDEGMDRNLSTGHHRGRRYVELSRLKASRGWRMMQGRNLTGVDAVGKAGGGVLGEGVARDSGVGGGVAGRGAMGGEHDGEKTGESQGCQLEEAKTGGFGRQTGHEQSSKTMHELDEEGNGRHLEGTMPHSGNDFFLSTGLSTV